MAARDFQPSFYKQFQCVVPDCVDSCCTHWQISIDKPTYEYMLYQSKLRAEAPQALVRTPRGESYTLIQLDEQQKCPLLDAQGWCRVQQQDGLAHLSDTCRLYPRQALFRGGWLTEHTLLLSCPEVVRMLLERNLVGSQATDQGCRNRQPRCRVCIIDLPIMRMFNIGCGSC